MGWGWNDKSQWDKTTTKQSKTKNMLYVFWCQWWNYYLWIDTLGWALNEKSHWDIDRMPSLGQALAASWGRQSRGDPAERKGLLHRLTEIGHAHWSQVDITIDQSHNEIRHAHWSHVGITIDQSHKCHNAPIPYPTVYHLEQNVHISVLNGVLWEQVQVHCGIFKIDLLICHIWSTNAVSVTVDW